MTADPWKAIDSAPREGTKVDLWCDGFRLTDCWWQDENAHFPGRPVGWICSKNAGQPFALSGINAEPTHYMIPAPPAPSPQTIEAVRAQVIEECARICDHVEAEVAAVQATRELTGNDAREQDLVRETSRHLAAAIRANTGER